MTSLQSKIVISAIRNRHLFKFHLKPDVITDETSTLQFRRGIEKSAQRNKQPKGIESTKIEIQGLPEGLRAEWIHPTGTASLPTKEEKVIFYTHGGGYISGNCADHRLIVGHFVQATGISALLYDYRLAPEFPFPAAMEDTLVVYKWLLSQGVNAQNIQIVGESAGGGLCLASLLAIRDTGLALPNAALAFSPWLDLKSTSPSFTRNAHKDISTLGSWYVWGPFYCGKNDPENPWISPLYGDLKGLPPIIIQVGDYEIMLDDSIQFANKAKEAGVDMTLHVWPEMVHCFPLLAPLFPEATAAWNESIRFLLSHFE
ncbi:Monoterpene epsilon-lactone hydrolase [bioreactor metagenome]|uniref:Monoterpene epsilon-lactone hydrolase n=1 Tax=bioreactor metagenome TaxID=1076179 RepID=A0A644X9U0_9ZZZZ